MAVGAGMEAVATVDMAVAELDVVDVYVRRIIKNKHVDSRDAMECRRQLEPI